MKRCKRCNGPREPESLDGYCGWCDKIMGETQAELAAERISEGW